MLKLTRRSLRTRPAPGQTLVEFAMLMLILVPFLVLLAVMLLSLYQASSVNQGASWLGQRIASSGTACTDGTTTCDWVADFKNQMAGLGVVVGPSDTIAVSITSPDGTVRYFDQTQPTVVPTTAYGDTIMVRFLKPLTGGLFAGSGFQDIIENMPGSSDTWVGVAQLEKGPGSSGIPVVADFGLNYTATVTSDAPSAYWRLAESGGTVLNETSGDGSKLGTIGPSVGTGAPSLIAAGTDSAFSFDGSAGSWLSVPDSSALAAGPGGAFSVEFWLAFSSDCVASEQPILVRGSSAIVLSPAAGCAGNTLSVSLGSGLQFSAAPAILRDSPHHIVVTYDGTQRANGYVEAHIFIDGVNAPLRGGPSDNRFAASTVSSWTGFGGELFWAAQNSGSSERFTGSLDELALYARPLTSDLVALHYAAGTKNGNVLVDAGRTIYFQDLSNGLPSSWQWDFGGGHTSNVENPTFAWPSAGTENVSLTVGSNTKSISVVVVAPPSVSPAFGFDYAALSMGLAPVSYWRLDEGSGATMVDAMGHVAGAYTGAVSFGPGLLVGSSDQGLILGSSAFSVSAPDNAALDLGSFSVSLQIKRARTGVAEDLWSRDNVSLGISSDNRLELRLPGGTVRSNIVLTATNLVYDIVATYAGGQAHLFINGTDVSSVTGSIPTSLTLAGITYLGGTTAPLAGSLDEVAIYSRALSAADIGSLDGVAHQNAINVAAGAAVAFVNQTGGTPLYVFWDFGDGSGSAEVSPTHRYNGVGTYTVRLTVETAGGWASVVSQNLVTVHL
jgi:PKD repeat protein